MNRIIIDLPVILDPHKLLVLLGGLGRTHDEILVPDILQYIEVWAPLSDNWRFPPITLRMLEENFDDKLDRFFGFNPQEITQANFCAGLRLFRYAYDKTMVSLVDSQRLTKVGQQILKMNAPFNPFYNLNLPGGGKVNVNPDAPLALESLIGAQEELGAIPICGDLEFWEFAKSRLSEGRIREFEGQVEIDTQAKLLLDCPKVVTFDELIWFAQNRDQFNAVSDKLKFANDWHLTRREVGMMGLKFAGTFAADAVLFAGAPMSSGGLLAYEVLSRIIRVTSKRDKAP